MAGMLAVFGTRPEAIKLLPVIAALRTRGVPVRCCTTGQHRDLLDQALGWNAIVPDIELGLMQPGEPLGVLTGRMIGALTQVLADERPDRVIVQGDTASALAGAQAAFLAGIPVAHVEAGLRTNDLAGPHPEEGIRRMIATIADCHFAPTAGAAAALRREGVAEADIHVTGNTVIDALRMIEARSAKHPVVETLHGRAAERRLIVVTCHRRENLARLDGIAAALADIAQRPDVFIVVLMHPNPAAREPLRTALGAMTNVALEEPLEFIPFVRLLSSAQIVLTDSGGVQEEAPALGIPALVLRDTTERPEGIEAGTAILVGTRPADIVRHAIRLLDNPLAHARMARRHLPYGDGRAADRIADILAARDGWAAASVAV